MHAEIFSKELYWDSRYYSFLIIQSTYKLVKKYQSIHANKYIQLTKYDKKYKNKYGAVIQCKTKPIFFRY